MSDNWQPDPEYVEYLRESAPEEDFFYEKYGFTHDCHCAEDYEEGNVGMVSECWSKMAADALNRCEAYKDELQLRMLQLATLKIQILEKGDEPRV